jgi:dihydroorotate dehydrogenase subfamily 1
MADLSCNLAGIKSPNPFWIGSGPPANTGYQAHRAFEAGWGGVVWKTIGIPIVNVSSRYSALNHGKDRMIGLNNIELISDRSPEVNFKEIAEVKKRWPHHAVIASLMVETREQWHEFVQRAADAGADGIELNYGCPHGMCERGMGSAVGQQPAVAEKITSWVMEKATIPVIVKLTPNITDITMAARAAKRAGANAISLINTINSITNVNLDTFVPEPTVRGLSSHGGYCGPAVKPIALNMLQACAADPDVNLPISGIGGITTWRDAAEFIALGATSLQALRLPHRGGHERRPERLPRFEGHEVPRRPARQIRPEAAEVGEPRPELPACRPHRLREVHRLQPLLHRLRRRRPPVHRSEESRGTQGWPRPRPRAAQARAQGPRGGLRRLQSLFPRLPGRRVHHDGRNPQREDLHDLEQLPRPPRQGRDAAHPTASLIS